MNQPQSAVGNCLDVQSFINAQPISRYQWRVVILCFLIVFLDGLDTAAMGFIAPALSQDWGIDRASLGPVMSAALIGIFYLLAGVFAYAVGQSLGNITLLATLVLVAGMCVNGAQSAMPSLAARFYPTQGRATGVSWMLGIGRFGAILGAWMGATLLGLGWNFEQVLTALVIPAALATTAVVIKGMVSHADAT